MITIEWYKIAGIVVGLGVIYAIGYYFIKDGSTNKYYRKAQSYHKEAEECYDSEDFDLAEEYYAKAEEFRQKGRELA